MPWKKMKTGAMEKQVEAMYVCRVWYGAAGEGSIWRARLDLKEESCAIAFVLKVHGTLTSRDGWKRTDSIHGQKGSCCSASFKYSEAFRFMDIFLADAEVLVTVVNSGKAAHQQISREKSSPKLGECWNPMNTIPTLEWRRTGVITLTGRGMCPLYWNGS
mmetsp:Transcript_76805/g.207030  ORF Transcript_76805/g.207030 Transcript_76805/m.207030 type:complete len:160 (-) Transcript_76805:1642-2121(-)